MRCSMTLENIGNCQDRDALRLHDFCNWKTRSIEMETQRDKLWILDQSKAKDYMMAKVWKSILPESWKNWRARAGLEPQEDEPRGKVG